MSLISDEFNLSPRQKQVAELILKGYSTIEIAKHLRVQLVTANRHRSILYKKLGVHSAVELAMKLITSKDFSISSISRSIEFEPEHLQAGISILSYFNEVLSQKEPSVKAKVRIEQEGRKVKLQIVDLNASEKMIVESTLADYAAVVSGQLLPKDFLADKFHVMQLENKLELTKVELSTNRRILEMQSAQFEQQLRTLQDDVQFLRRQLAASIRLTSTQIDSQNELIELFENSRSSDLTSAFELIKTALMTDRSKELDTDELVSALSRVKEKEPSFFKKLQSFAANAASSGIGSVIAELIKNM